MSAWFDENDAYIGLVGGTAVAVAWFIGVATLYDPDTVPFALVDGVLVPVVVGMGMILAVLAGLAACFVVAALFGKVLRVGYAHTRPRIGAWVAYLRGGES